MTEIERKKRYRQHRSRIEKATSVIDSQAPKNNREPKEQRELSFIEMMAALYSKRNHRTFTKSPIRVKQNSAANMKTKVMGKLKLRENITSQVSFLQKSYTRNVNPFVEVKSPRDLTKFSCTIPSHIWQRYSHLSFLRTPQTLQKLLRPKVFIDLYTCRGQPLGRVEIQLFTEACPEIVLQFFRVCMQGQHTKFNFTRLLAPLWVEGELQLDDKNALTGTNVEHDPMAINHGSGAGILSFPSRYLRGSKFRFISFTISFKPIDVLNGKRIAFGKIRRGLHVLDNLQNFEVSRSGKPANDIVVTSCGVL